MKEQLVARAFILNSKKEVFLCERAQDPGKGKMEMPGGKVDPGETPEIAVIREMREETGLVFDPNPKDPIGTHTDIDQERNIAWVTHYFHGTVIGERNLDPTEVASSGHFSKEEIEEGSFEMPFAQRDRVMEFYDWYESDDWLILPREPSE